MESGDLPDDVEALKALVLQERATRLEAEAAKQNSDDLVAGLSIDTISNLGSP